MSDMTIGFAITGSFCTFKAVFPQMNLLVEHGYHVLPIMSENVYTTDTRFGRAADWVAQAEEVCGEKVIHTIAQAEPIGPKKLLDLLILAPCTGNTLGKLAGRSFNPIHFILRILFLKSFDNLCKSTRRIRSTEHVDHSLLFRVDRGNQKCRHNG